MEEEVGRSDHRQGRGCRKAIKALNTKMKRDQELSRPLSSRLQRIRPLPLAQIINRPPPLAQVPAFGLDPPQNDGLVGGQQAVQPFSPLPSLPVVHTSANHSDSVSSYKGIPNTTSKYLEDKRVNWHSTPFEVRLEKALDRGAVEA
ncbi:unnamed protein product [Fraxinus pennsylvanica]|uniref:Uncharacterized protein n=1 Tax=Fraxinus pennsylvanica TaxID=56036 RepID=A0AAD1ZEA9_9LAMI|nr:unnamed protein product [Fraxinus pennsylvanica]